MCTLSIHVGKKRSVITMNRDERRNREESGMIHSRSANGVRAFYPVDNLSGGTWFGINDRGVVLAILNRYQDVSPVTNPLSRGGIIPTALGQGDFESVNRWLGAQDYASFSPFDLFLIGRKQFCRFIWNGVALSVRDVRVKHWFLFTSSFINAEEVTAYRKNIFAAWSKEVGKKLTDPEEVLRGFHLIQIEGMESQSVLMEREHSHTKSIIQAELGKEDVVLKYFPEVLKNLMSAPLLETVAVK